MLAKNRLILKSMNVHARRAFNSGAVETKRMNYFTAINDAMRIALKSDPTAIVMGEDVAFGGVFRCSVGLMEEFGMLQCYAL